MVLCGMSEQTEMPPDIKAAWESLLRSWDDNNRTVEVQRIWYSDAVYGTWRVRVKLNDIVCRYYYSNGSKRWRRA
jgi:hypothetical protein